MTNVANFSPVSLSYTAALRGVTPRRPGDTFSYALFGCASPSSLIGLAASNPEGQFYGLIADAAKCDAAGAEARSYDIPNVHFMRDGAGLPKLDYLCCDAGAQDLGDAERNTLFDLATRQLRPNGLFAYSYRTGKDTASNLRFLVREFAPEMNAQQANEFLIELKKLGTLYFKDDVAGLAKLNQAIAKAMPDDYFAAFDAGEARSSTFDAIVALRPRGFAYAGDCVIQSNYVELAVTAEAQALVVQCRENPLYEMIKDFALNRTVRHDIWVRQPAAMSGDPAVLFGGFAYGITQSRDEVPMEFAAQGKTISFGSALNQELIDIMTLTPAGIGDLLAHENTRGYGVKAILEAIQVLVACGIARPMRGNRSSSSVDSIAQPRFAGSFNQHLDKTTVTDAAYTLASPVMGDVIRIPARDVLVMQALDRAGLANSVESLLGELQKLAANPVAAARIMDAAVPTEDIARTMIETAVQKSIVQWYAYGLLEAA